MLCDKQLIRMSLILVVTKIYVTSSLSLLGDGKLDYDTFFKSKIKAKMQDNSYRRFRILARSSDRTPTAKQFKDTSIRVKDGRDITVWCSNDYLGMLADMF